MTATQTIESQDITVGGVFQSFYAVPDYQREYVWRTHVEQLLIDILGEMPTKPQDAPPAEYFIGSIIGSIVVCPNAAGVLELIDGQQRMTTLFVTLCAIRDRLEALKDTVETPINGQLSSQSIGRLGPVPASLSARPSIRGRPRRACEAGQEGTGRCQVHDQFGGEHRQRPHDGAAVPEPRIRRRP